MSEFWLWMEKKGYGLEQYGNCWVKHFTNPIISPTKQMLIGYMIEYLFKQGVAIVTIPYEEQIKTDIHDLYKYLEERIESYEG